MSLLDSNSNNNYNEEGQYTPTLVLQIMLQMVMQMPLKVPAGTTTTNRDKTCVVQ